MHTAHLQKGKTSHPPMKIPKINVLESFEETCSAKLSLFFIEKSSQAEQIFKLLKEYRYTHGSVQ